MQKYLEYNKNHIGINKKDIRNMHFNKCFLQKIALKDKNKQGRT